MRISRLQKFSICRQFAVYRICNFQLSLQIFIFFILFDGSFIAFLQPIDRLAMS